MRKILKNSNKTKLYLENASKIYLVALWAKYGVREYAFSGKYKMINGLSIPLVYNYYDGNGLYDEWHLVPITFTTSGNILFWTQSKEVAEKTAELWNREKEVI